MIKRYTQFLLDKVKGETTAKLRYRVKWMGEIVAFSVGFRVDVTKWSPETQRCKLSTTHGIRKVSASVINKEIERFARACDKVFDSFALADKIPTADEFRDSFNREIGKPSRVGKAAPASFFEVFDLFVLTMGSQNGWSKATHTKFGAIKGHLTAFDHGLSLASFSDSTFQALVAYMHRIPLRNTTISKNVAFVRWFLRWASHNGYYKGTAHETFRARLKGVDGNSKEVIHLTWDELIAVYNFDFSKATKTQEDGSALPLDPENAKALERVRDVFCFCCFTGLRYSDVAKLSRSDMRDKYILVVTQKTADALKIELNNYSRAILEKYEGFPFKRDRALPIISNVNMNLALKVMGELVGLNEPQRIVYFMGNKRHEEVYPKYSLLTTHCGRRTFIVSALRLGIPSEVIMKFTGHSDFKSMKPYIKIVDSLKEQEMEKFNRGLVPGDQNGD